MARGGGICNWECLILVRGEGIYKWKMWFENVKWMMGNVMVMGNIMVNNG